MKPLFEENADATLERVRATYAERGTQYGDTWRNSQHLILRAAYQELTGAELPLKYCDAIASAVLCDIKYQRNEGGYKDDTLVDAIAYTAYHAESMRKALSHPHP